MTSLWSSDKFSNELSDEELALTVAPSLDAIHEDSSTSKRDAVERKGPRKEHVTNSRPTASESGSSMTNSQLFNCVISVQKGLEEESAVPDW